MRNGCCLECEGTRSTVQAKGERVINEEKKENSTHMLKGQVEQRKSSMYLTHRGHRAQPAGIRQQCRLGPSAGHALAIVPARRAHLRHAPQAVLHRTLHRARWERHVPAPPRARGSLRALLDNLTFTIIGVELRGMERRCRYRRSTHSSSSR